MPSPLLSALTAAPGPHPPLAELRAYAAGELTGPAAHQVEAHTLACGRCADLLEGLQVTDPATTNRLLTDLEQRLRQRVGELELAQQSGVMPAGRFRAWPRLAAAAALVAGLGAGIWGWQHQSPASHKVSEVAAVQTAPAQAPVASPSPVPAGATAAEVPRPPAAPAKARRPMIIAAAPAAPNRLLTRKAAKSEDAFGAAASRVVSDAVVVQAEEMKDKDLAAAPAAVVAAAKAASPPAASEAAPARASQSDTLPGAASVTARASAPEVASKLRASSEASAPRTRAALPAPPALEPTPTGGYQALRTYLQKQATEFEPEAPLEPLKGVVRVRFTVSAAGKPELEQAKILRSLRADYDAEVLRMLAEGPTWVPGVAAGRRAPLPVQVEVLF